VGTSRLIGASEPGLATPAQKIGGLPTPKLRSTDFLFNVNSSIPSPINNLQHGHEVSSIRFRHVVVIMN
jgi:hypothetical protein